MPPSLLRRSTAHTIPVNYLGLIRITVKNCHPMPLINTTLTAWLEPPTSTSWTFAALQLHACLGRRRVKDGFSLPLSVSSFPSVPPNFTHSHCHHQTIQPTLHTHFNHLPKPLLCLHLWSHPSSPRCHHALYCWSGCLRHGYRGDPHSMRSRPETTSLHFLLQNIQLYPPALQGRGLGAALQLMGSEGMASLAPEWQWAIYSLNRSPESHFHPTDQTAQPQTGTMGPLLWTINFPSILPSGVKEHQSQCSVPDSTNVTYPRQILYQSHLITTSLPLSTGT